MIGTRVEALGAKLAAIRAAAAAAMPNRTHSDSFQHYTERAAADLKKGVVTVLSAGERDYNQGLGMEAREGTTRVVVVGHLAVAEGTVGKDIEAAEVALIEEIKAFVRTGVAGMRLTLESVQHSRQLEHPYGWVVAYVDARPPGHNII